MIAISPSTAEVINEDLEVQGDLTIDGALKVGELYYSPLQSISLAVGSERWVKLATIPNNHLVRFQLRSGSQNSEEVAEIRVLGTYHNSSTAISVERQTYNEHLREVRVVGSNGGSRLVYIKIRATGYAPSVQWRVLDSRGVITIHNVEETPTGGLAHLISGNLVDSTNMNLVTTGSVGIGTTNLTHKLAVKGTIRANEVIVDTGWADYVFAEDYDLAPLSEVEAHIEENGHLPNIPSASDVATNGVSLGEMQSLLLVKIEELTLHQIRQEKLLVTQRIEIENLKKHVSEIF